MILSKLICTTQDPCYTRIGELVCEFSKIFFFQSSQFWHLYHLNCYKQGVLPWAWQWRERCRKGDNSTIFNIGRQREKKLPVAGSLPIQIRTGTGRAKAVSWLETHSQSPKGWQRLSYLSHQLMPSRVCIGRKLVLSGEAKA